MISLRDDLLTHQESNASLSRVFLESLKRSKLVSLFLYTISTQTSHLKVEREEAVERNAIYNGDPESSIGVDNHVSI